MKADKRVPKNVKVFLSMPTNLWIQSWDLSVYGLENRNAELASLACGGVAPREE